MGERYGEHVGQRNSRAPFILSVRGVKNLKVVDASVFPHLTSGNPHAAILMIAERAADFILQDIELEKRNAHN
ncbi:hypothetical protein TNCV_1320831 [Trichonephila clavipes]|nr:hypothetical protein TNCV_1320831 [Trichonephila clavipes]